MAQLREEKVLAPKCRNRFHYNKLRRGRLSQPSRTVNRWKCGLPPRTRGITRWVTKMLQTILPTNTSIKVSRHGAWPGRACSAADSRKGITMNARPSRWLVVVFWCMAAVCSVFVPVATAQTPLGQGGGNLPAAATISQNDGRAPSTNVAGTVPLTVATIPHDASVLPGTVKEKVIREQTIYIPTKSSARFSRKKAEGFFCHTRSSKSSGRRPRRRGRPFRSKSRPWRR